MLLFEKLNIRLLKCNFISLQKLEEFVSEALKYRKKPQKDNENKQWY